MDLDPKALALFNEGYEKIVEGLGVLGYDIGDENFVGTAARAAKGFHELVLGQTHVAKEVEAFLAKTFPAKYTEMVISKHNTAFGVCPHHLLPVGETRMEGARRILPQRGDGDGLGLTQRFGGKQSRQSRLPAH